MKLRSGLFGASVLMAGVSLVAGGSGGIFAPQACVSPAVLIALTALPTDAIGAIAQERLNTSTQA